MVFFLVLALLQPQQDNDTRLAHWKEDLILFADSFKTKHIRPFTKISEADFDQAIKDIDPAKFTDQQITIKLWELLARVGDSHSYVMPPRSLLMLQCPLAVTYLTDGWYIFGIYENHAEALKGKLTRIGSIPIAEVENRLKALAANDNRSYERSQLQRHMVMADALQALGIVADPKSVEFGYTTPTGEEKTVTLQPQQLPRNRWKLAIHPENWPDHLKQNRRQHGFTWLADNSVLYIWYDRCTEFANYPIKQWTQDVLTQIDDKKPAKVIVDLRRNGGGSSVLLEPMINSLAKKDINDSSRLFVLIGPGTFSSAMMNAQHFKTRTKATLAGEPTGGSPNHFGEVKTFTLPHSKFIVQYSTKRFQMTKDDATTIEPHVLVTQTANGVFTDRDEVLDAVLKK